MPDLKLPSEGARSPAIVAAADWSASAAKRWLATAERLDGNSYVLGAPEPVGEPGKLFDRLLGNAGPEGTALLGFDFPIGLPRCYAARTGIESFRAGLAAFGRAEWLRFYEVSDRPTLRQPFGPMANDRGGLRRDQLAKVLGLASEEELYRACDRRTPIRGRAEALFFTRFAKQVGRAAIYGWRDVLQPAAAQIRLWPFDGRLQDLLANPGIVVAEIYPAEAAAHLGLSLGSAVGGKGNVENRRAAGRALRNVLHEAGQRLAPDVERQLTSGFPNDDAFDSFVGLVSILLVLLGQHPTECPDDPAIRRIEGWILGQAAPSAFLLRPESEWVASNRLAFAIGDGFPVSPGHTLIVPKRMVSTWFEATAAEKAAMVDLLEVVRRHLDDEHQPDGYNVGFNAGEAAGQTVRHLHLHVIPRYRGDVEDPRGGIRHVIPGKGNYLKPGSR